MSRRQGFLSIRHSDSVWSVTISRDGRSLASGSEDKTIKIWRLDTGELRASLIIQTQLERLPWADPYTAPASRTRQLRFGLVHWELLRTLSGHSQGVWSVAISPDGRDSC